MKNVKLIIAIALAVIGILFVLQNAEPVGIEFLVWTWTASRALVLLVVFLVGVGVGWLVRAGRRR